MPFDLSPGPRVQSIIEKRPESTRTGDSLSAVETISRQVTSPTLTGPGRLSIKYLLVEHLLVELQSSFDT